MPIPEGVPIFSYNQYLDADGVFQAAETIEKGATSMLDELHRWVTALKSMRAGNEAELLATA